MLQRIFTTGGAYYNSPVQSSYVLRRSQDRWYFVGNMNSKRSRHGCGVVLIGSSKYAIVAGGMGPNNTPLRTVEKLPLDALVNNQLASANWENGTTTFY